MDRMPSLSSLGGGGGLLNGYMITPQFFFSSPTGILDAGLANLDPTLGFPPVISPSPQWALV